MARNLRKGGSRTAEVTLKIVSGHANMDSTLSIPCDEVMEEARRRLRRSPYMPVRLLSCEFERGVLRLRGRLSSFYQKQLAQEAVVDLAGVAEVVNEVAVIPR